MTKEEVYELFDSHISDEVVEEFASIGCRNRDCNWGNCPMMVIKNEKNISCSLMCRWCGFDADEGVSDSVNKMFAKYAVERRQGFFGALFN